MPSFLLNDLQVRQSHLANGLLHGCQILDFGISILFDLIGVLRYSVDLHLQSHKLQKSVVVLLSRYV
jgi:hypothetical protein